MVDSRIHHRFASDVKRTVAGIIMLRADPPRGIGGSAPRRPMEVAAGAGPQEWSIRAFFGVSRYWESGGWVAQPVPAYL